MFWDITNSHKIYSQSPCKMIKMTAMYVLYLVIIFPSFFIIRKAGEIIRLVAFIRLCVYTLKWQWRLNKATWRWREPTCLFFYINSDLDLWPWALTLTFTHDLDIIFVHHHTKFGDRQMVPKIWFFFFSDFFSSICHGWTDGRTDGRTEGNA